jgi:Family of unknown function (DUF5686)
MRGGLSLRRRFESIYYSTAEISGGLLTEQFNSENPITPLANTIYTLQARKNFLKIYEKAFVKASFRRRVVPGLLLRVGLEYADRSPLRNTTDYSFNKKSERAFTINDIPGNASKPEWSFFTRHQAFIADIEAEFRFGEEYSTYPKFRSYNTSKWPILTLRYRGAFQGVAGSDVGYNFVRADIRQNDISWGLVGYSNIRLAAGAFVQKKQLQPMDAYFPLGNPSNSCPTTSTAQNTPLWKATGNTTSKAGCSIKFPVCAASTGKKCWEQGYLCPLNTAIPTQHLTPNRTGNSILVLKTSVGRPFAPSAWTW